MIQVQPANVDDFSGGITDNVINAAANMGQAMENLNVQTNKSLLLRPGSEIDDLADDQIPVGNQRIGALINYKNNDTLFVQSARRFYYRDPSTYATLTGPTGNQVLSAGDTTNYISHTQWNGHLYVTSDAYPQPQKIYKDSGGDLQVRTAGLPQMAAPTVTAGAAGANSYVYAFHYFYEYTVGNETHQDFGPTTIVQLSNSDDPSSTTNPITVIPVLANGVLDNHDTTVIKVYIYRTINGGTTLYKIGDVTNGTTTFNDTFADSAIQTNQVIYTEGGVQSNEFPPLAKFIHVVRGVCYYAHIKSGTDIFPSDVYQSIPQDPDSVPGTFRDTVEDEITGLSSVNETPMVLCKKSIYRIEGQLDELGRGTMDHISIHDHAGCISNFSIVQAEQGLFWAGNDGFWYSDGYKCLKISDHLNDTYLSLKQAHGANLERLQGVYDEQNRRILWSLQTDAATDENETVFVCELRWGVKPNMCFTTWEGGLSFRPTYMEFFDDVLYRADSRGYVFKHETDIPTDPKVNVAAAASTWQKQTIIWDYQSVVSNFGSNFKRKFATKILMTMKNRSNLSLQVNAINDDGKFVRNLKQIRYRNNFIWGDTEFTWGDPDFVWNAEGLIEQWRWLPSRGLRFAYLQIQLTNAYTIITNSDSLGQSTVAPGPMTVVLDDAAAIWPADSVDYFVSFEQDNYEKQYLVTARTDTTLTVDDADGTLPTGSVKWQLSGYRKNEILQLLSYTVHYAILSKSHSTLEAGGLGGNE